jgi:hypothetical protein
VAVECGAPTALRICIAMFFQRLRTGLTCDAPLALWRGWLGANYGARLGRRALHSAMGEKGGVAVLRGREERFIARKRRGAMGRRSSLRDPAHVLGSVFECEVQKGVRRKKPGRFGRNDHRKKQIPHRRSQRARAGSG